MKKKTLIMSVSLFFFFHNIGPNWPKFCPKTTATSIFFTGFQWNMLKGYINIDNSGFDLSFSQSYFE